MDALNEQLARRQKGYGAGGRMKIERDRVNITGGVVNQRTTGAPIALEVVNRDWKNWRKKAIDPMTTPRPGHADLTGAIKYGHRELRLALERASARETAMRVAAGAICRQLLAAFDIEVGGYVTQLGDASVDDHPSVDPEIYRGRFRTALTNELTCPDLDQVEVMRDIIKRCRKSQDTLGGVFEVVALNLPPGLGSYVQWDRRLDARLGMAMLSIQAMKGVEIGPAFDNAVKHGTDVHDEIFRRDDGSILRKTNRAGGLEGGVTTGEPLLVRVAMKPISTTLNPRQSVNLASGDADVTTYERSDFCALPRAVPIGEAMLSMVLADALMEKLGGDSIAEMTPRFTALRRAHVDDLPMDNAVWHFDYEGAE